MKETNISNPKEISEKYEANLKKEFKKETFAVPELVPKDNRNENETITDERCSKDKSKAGLNSKSDENLFKEIRAQYEKVNEILDNRNRNKEILLEHNEGKNSDPDRIIDNSDTNSVSLNPSIQMEEQVKPRSSKKKKSHQCDLCFKTFSQKAKLKFHLVKVHKMGNLKLDINKRLYNNTSESFLCDVCEERSV